MEIKFLLWNGVMYVQIEHEYTVDEVSVIKTGVTVKLKKKPAVFTATCIRCQKKHTAETKEQAQTNMEQCNHLPEVKP